MATAGDDPARPGRRRPARYRSDRPIWADTAFAALAAVTTGTAVLAAVRSATTGLPVTATAAAPFGEGRWLFSHNGLVRGWPGAVAGSAAELPVTDLLTLDAPTDSALLWALVRHRLRAGDDPAAVLAGVVRAVAAAAPGSRLNLLLTDGAAVWATTWTHALSVRVGAGAVTVASEPLDGSGGWVAVPDRHLVVATPQRCDVRPLDADAPTPPPGAPRRRDEPAAGPRPPVPVPPGAAQHWHARLAGAAGLAPLRHDLQSSEGVAWPPAPPGSTSTSPRTTRAPPCARMCCSG